MIEERRDTTITLKLTEQLQKENIVKLFEADSRCIHLVLNHAYPDINIISDIDKKSWKKTTENFIDLAAKKGIQQQHINMLDDVLAENYKAIGEICKNGKADTNTDSSNSGSEKRGDKHVFVAFKYSQNGRGQLNESIILDGLPYFVRYDKASNQFLIDKEIEESSRIIRPPAIEECPFTQYEFKNKEELNSYLERARNTSIDALYLRWKKIVYTYNKQDKHKLNLITLDIVWSWFQDKFSTTHYHGVVGTNGAGKSSIGETFQNGAYRGVNFTNPSAANIYRVLSTVEPAQCTLIMDEVDRLEDDEIQSILKTGYRNNADSKVPKTNTNSWKQEYFYTYNLKVLLAENSPNQWKTRGIIDRTFSYSAFTDIPDRLIEETTNPQGNPKRQARLDEILDLRKLTLAYRLIHFSDPIPDIDVGVTGRNMQLTKPYIQLFYNTPVQDEIVEILQKFLNKRSKLKSTSLMAILIPLIQKLLTQEGTKMTNDDGEECIKIKFSRIWETIKVNVDGVSDPNKPNEFDTDYGKLYRSHISKNICDQFGAVSDTEGHQKTVFLIFDTAKVNNLAEVYKTTVEIRVGPKTDDDEDEPDPEPDISASALASDSTDNDEEPAGPAGPAGPYSGTHTPPNDKNTDSNSCKNDHSKGYTIPPYDTADSADTANNNKMVGFWQVINTLLEKERLNPNNHMSDDKDTIGKNDIIETLYENGYCSGLEAENLINDAVRSGELKIVATDTYRKAK
jgi:hypothetical protein